jgi:glycosyltransferase involved in cell wall biosynthesis
LYIVRTRPNFIIVEPGIGTLGFIWKPLLSRLLKFQVILDVRSTPVGVSGFRNSFKRLQFNVAVLTAKMMFDGMSIITGAMRREVSEKFNLDVEAIGVWPDAASLELFSLEDHVDYGAKLRKQFGLSEKFVVFYHGHIGLARGALESSEAIVRIDKEYPDIVLFFLGTGSSETLNALKRLIQKHGVQDRVIVHEPVRYEDVPKYVAMCDVGIVPLPNTPMWRNQCPLKLLEYLAMERTVIVTDIPANREIVGDRKCGIYISSCDPAEIAEAMIFACVNRANLAEWGKTGRTIVVQEYNWDKAAENLETYLLKVEHGLAGW